MLKSVLIWIEKYSKVLIDLVTPERQKLSLVKHIDDTLLDSITPADHVSSATWIHSLFVYKNKYIQALVWELKYKNTTLPLEFIGKRLYDEILALVSDITLFDADAKFLLIPVPISPLRRNMRGYNQSEYIARSILECDDHHILLYTPQWLEKIKDTLDQNKLNREERIENIKGCFVAHEGVVDAYVILIDDVVTTGSTLSEARQTLLEKGAKDVFAFTIAH